MSTTPQWNCARIVIAHDCNNGQIPKIQELISQLERFHADEVRRVIQAERALAEKAAEPFIRLFNINAPLQPSNHTPLRDYMPGVWPTMRDLAVLVAAVSAKAARRCPNDTDGDGDCHLCAKNPGGCPILA